MARRLEEGFDAAFTIDGPRGPRYVAKPGPVMLARKTGRPIYVFHIGVEKAHTLEKAWDKMQIPHFFSRAVMVGAPLIFVSPDADADELKRKHAEMQAALERVRDVAESWFGLSEAERERAAGGMECLTSGNYAATRSFAPCATPAIKPISSAAACAMFCSDASLLTTTSPPTPRPTRSCGSFLKPMRWVHSLALCWCR